jgi:hypothetical protein
MNQQQLDRALARFGAEVLRGALRLLEAEEAYGSTWKMETWVRSLGRRAMRHRVARIGLNGKRIPRMAEL